VHPACPGALGAGFLYESEFHGAPGAALQADEVDLAELFLVVNIAATPRAALEQHL
jgi:hypothetical protein